MMLGFMDACTLWLNLPFTRKGSTKDLILAHSDLAEADEYVTTVIRFAESGIFKPAPVDVPAMLEELMQRIDRLGDTAVCLTALHRKRRSQYRLTAEWFSGPVPTAAP